MSYFFYKKINKEMKFTAIKCSFLIVIILSSLFYSKESFGEDYIDENNELLGVAIGFQDSLRDNVASGIAKILTSKQKKKIDKIISTAKKIREESREIHKLINSKKSFDLPIGKTQDIADGSVTISIDSIFLTPKGGYLNASALIDVPCSKKKLAFGADHIGFNKGGLTGDARLMLIGNESVPMGKSAEMYFIGQHKKTFIDWDCNGYTGMSIEGVVQFNDKILKPVKKGAKYVYGHFTTEIVNFSDFVTDISLDPFEVKGLKGFKFTANNVVIDQSSKKNSSIMKFPKGYRSTSMPEKNSTFWKGLYLEKLKVELPSHFREVNQQKNKELFVKSAIIDEMGFTGFAGAENLISIEKGDMGGWSYSLDELAINLKYNKLNGAYFKGKIKVPLTKENDTLGYVGLIQPNNKYLLKADLKSNISLDKIGCEGVLAKSSYLEVGVENERFSATALLNGWMRPKNNDLLVKKITFQELYLSSKAPFFDVKLFGLGLNKSFFGSFPIQIKKIGMQRRKANEYGIGIDMDLNLCPSFSGSTEVVILTKKEPERIRFKYKGLDIGKVEIEVQNGFYSISGSANWFKSDPVYGKGFQGMVEAEFKPGFGIQASAIFGNVDGDRYWYVDGLYTDNVGIPVFPGLHAYSFGGGMYYRMRQGGLAISKNQLGATPSGILYKPDKNAGIGLKARVKMGSPDKNAVTVDAFYEMAFNRRGGLDYISFEGNGKFMSKLDNIEESTIKKESVELAKILKVPQGTDIRLNSPNTDGISPAQEKMFGSEREVASKSSISAKAKIKYDFIAKSLHAAFRVYLNSGRGVIQGVGPSGLAGWAEIHYDPKDWYCFIGTPEKGKRVGVKIFNGLKTESYFMVGTKILGSPPPPEEVTEILGAGDLDYMRDFNALGAGKGFAFGSNVSLSTGNVSFLIFYGHFSAGAGFDIMLKNYGNNVRCKGSGKTPGIDGWYANGQAYAYIDGEIGIKIKIFGRRKKIHILDIGVAALLQAQLPNPLWMKGVVGGRYSVLGGLVRGRCKFEVQIGNKCELVGGSVLDQLDVISDITPKNGRKEVDVFTAFQSVFNMEIDKPFSMVDLDEVEKTYRIKLVEMSLKNKGENIKGNVEWNDKRDVAIFNSYDILPPKSKIDYKVKVQFEQMVGGVWKRLDGQTQEMKGYFTTGEAPDHIPQKNVAYSYPMPNQFNFFRKEYPKGYIKLIKGQPYLFAPDKKWDRKLRITCKDGKVILGDISYSDYTVHYDIPQELREDAIYKIEIVNIPKFKGKAIDSNITTQEVGKENAKINNRKAKEGTNITLVEEKILYDNYFRTSKYRKFKEKFRRIQFQNSWEWPISTGIYTAYKKFLCPEIFGHHDMHASKYNKPLIQFEAEQNNYWIKKELKPLMYTEYPLKGKYKLNWRNVKTLGIVPVHAIDIEQEDKNPTITVEHFLESNPVSQGQNFNIAYNLAQVSYEDFKEYRNKIAKDALRTTLPQLRKLMDHHYPFQPKDKYRVVVRYILPGINKVTFESKIVIPYLY